VFLSSAASTAAAAAPRRSSRARTSSRTSASTTGPSPPTSPGAGTSAAPAGDPDGRPTGAPAPGRGSGRAAREQGAVLRLAYSNPGCERRNDFFRVLSSKKHPDNAGRLLNNIGGLSDRNAAGAGAFSDLPGFCSRHKFAVAFENASSPGYTTEKIAAPLLGGCVPIYRGKPDITEGLAWRRSSTPATSARWRNRRAMSSRPVPTPTCTCGACRTEIRGRQAA